MEIITMEIECPSCKATGLYQGIGESKEVAVICYKCNGTGKFLYEFKYNKFTERKLRTAVKRVYKSGYGYKIGPGKIAFSNCIGTVDMDKEGVSYEEFISGKMPSDIESLACPMMADQGKCHEIDGFIERCNSFNDRWLHYIPDCKNKSNMSKCWKIFKLGKVTDNV